MAEVHPIVGPDWSGYSYPYGDGLLARVSFDAQVVEGGAPAGFDNSVRVILYLPPDRVRRDGQPATADELESILAQQRGLIDLLADAKVRCRFVGSMFYGGMCDLVFQVDPAAAAAFKDRAAEWAGSAAPYRVELRESAGWDFFDQKVRPSPENAQQIADKATIQALVEAGSDPARLHRLDHRIVGPPDALQRIEGDLVGNGFTNPRFPEPGVLVVNTSATLNLPEIWDTTARLIGYCANNGARYEGWGAAVIPREV